MPLLLVRPGAPLVASLLLVAMPFAPGSFLFLVVWPGATSSVGKTGLGGRQGEENDILRSASKGLRLWQGLFAHARAGTPSAPFRFVANVHSCFFLTLACAYFVSCVVICILRSSDTACASAIIQKGSKKRKTTKEKRRICLKIYEI